jgi:hypothetical protein
MNPNSECIKNKKLPIPFLSCTSAPYVINVLTVLGCPFLAACIRDVQPRLLGLSIIASWQRRYSTTSSLPLAAATCNAVTPPSSLQLTSTP